MINIYSENETNFKHNGLAILGDCITAQVLEKANAGYSLEIEYPVLEDGAWKYIIEGNIVKVPTAKYGEQLFRIVEKRKESSTVYAYAAHIFYDLLDNFLEDVRPTKQSGAGALEWILSNTQYPHTFKGLSDISRISTANYIRKNPVQALISEDENSYLNRWGGELERDNYTIKMLAKAGQGRGVTIAYGKNILGIEEEIDTSGVVTRLLLTGLDNKDQPITLPEKYIDSKHIGSYPHPKIHHIHCGNLKVNEDEGITLEMVYEALRDEAKRLYDVQKIDIPKINYTVSFAELSQTEEYKDYAILEKVYLYDTVTIKHSKLDIDIKAEVVSCKYDCIAKRYTEIELGNFKGNVNNEFQNLEKTLNKVADEIVNSKSDLQKAIDNATELLTSALGGYVIKRNGEILIMDTEDIMTATKVWRWNLNGLGYSKTGVNGPFKLAITMDGSIVASFITTGVLSANLIKAGILKSFNGKTWINMESGTFNFANKVVYDGDKFTIQMGDKTLDEFKNEYDSAKLQTSKDIADVQNSTNTLKDALGGYTADGILDKSEKQAIESLLKTLRTEKADIDAQYKAVYWNPDLLGAGATQLKDAYDYYISKYNNLITAINALLSSEKVTQADRTNTDLAFVEYDTVLGDYSKSVNNAIDAIAEKKKQDIKKYADAKFEVMDDKIVGKVSKGDFGTYVEQNHYAVKIAWNKISNYMQFENGGLSIYDGALTTSRKRATFDESGNHFWRDGYYLGKIGTNQYKYDASIKGIVFNLTVDGGYMSWSSKETSTSDAYTMVWTYANKVTGSYGANMLHAGVDIDMHYNTLRNVKFEGGGRSGTLNCVQIKQVNSDGTIQQWSNGLKMVFQNGILVDAAWSNS